MRHVPTLMMAIAFGLAAPLAPAAQAQTLRTVAQAPRITGFDVEQVTELTPGTELNFTVWGTPRAQAALQIDGARRAVELTEVSPGVYKGTYTISQRDRLAGNARVSANLRSGNQVGTATLDETLQSGPQRPVAAAAAPVIERFDVRHEGSARSGEQLRFTLRGTPGGRASVRLVGAQERFRLNEERPGEYVGTYAVRPTDRLDANAPVVARLRVGELTATSTLEHGLDANRLVSLPGATACLECATVTAINRVEVDGDGRYIGGTVAGGLLGAVLGNQIGQGNGRTAAQVAGVVGGALIGREVQKRRSKREHFEVVLRMRTDGSQQMVAFDDAPAFKVGDRVRLREGALTLDR